MRLTLVESPDARERKADLRVLSPDARLQVEPRELTRDLKPDDPASVTLKLTFREGGAARPLADRGGPRPGDGRRADLPAEAPRRGGPGDGRARADRGHEPRGAGPADGGDRGPAAHGPPEALPPRPQPVRSAEGRDDPGPRRRGRGAGGDGEGGDRPRQDRAGHEPSASPAAPAAAAAAPPGGADAARPGPPAESRGRPDRARGLRPDHLPDVLRRQAAGREDLPGPAGQPRRLPRDRRRSGSSRRARPRTARTS